jgi:DNA invertase Pin-like site-specific DNA recombinase
VLPRRQNLSSYKPASGVRLVAYVRVSREDERPQIVEVIRYAAVSGALPLAQRLGWQKVVQLLDGTDGIVVYALDRVARSLWDFAQIVREIEAEDKLLISVREKWLQHLDPKIR